MPTQRLRRPTSARMEETVVKEEFA